LQSNTEFLKSRLRKFIADSGVGQSTPPSLDALRQITDCHHGFWQLWSLWNQPAVRMPSLDGIRWDLLKSIPEFGSTAARNSKTQSATLESELASWPRISETTE